MATKISISNTRSSTLAIGGARQINIQNQGAEILEVLVEGSNDLGSTFSEIGTVRVPAEGSQVVNTQGFEAVYFTTAVAAATGDIAVNPFDRAASADGLQTVALNATPPVINTTAGKLIVVTGSTSATSIKLPPAPAAGEEVIIVNQATSAWTLSGNGNNIDGASSVNFPARLAPRGLIFDGDNWNTYDGVMPIQGTFTPALTTASENLTPTYSIQNGYYNVVGNLAFITGQISYSSKSGGTAGDNLRLTGIPAWLAPASGQRVTGYCSDQNDMFFQHALLDYGSVSASVWTFTKGINPGVGAAPVKVSDLAGACGDGVTFSAVYRIA